MKHLLIMICIALVMSTTGYEPPEGKCKQGEVWRCSFLYCSTTAAYCPTVYENGVWIPTDCHNKTTCHWDCDCVKKQKDEEE